ncbi:MAG TPA: aminopeptidase [Anaerolineae bacterium]|nr:aminopeptidase [Anaerolineae bacterium]
MPALSFEQKLQSYAELTVKVGLGLQPGQRLMIRAPLESAPLVRLIAASAYKAGGRLVEVLWNDDALTLARFNYAPRDSFEEFPTWRTQAMREVFEQGGASLRIYAEDPDLLKDQDPDLIDLVERVALTHSAPIRKFGMANLINWSVISTPTASWANKIFPGIAPAQQVANLWELIFEVCRVNQADPVMAWHEHIQKMKVKVAHLNAKQYAALKYSAPGTDLTLGLPDNHIWHGVEAETPTGITFIPNLPTEEVFTMPHKDRTEGVVASTKPLSYAGVLINDFSLTFEAGRVVKVTAKTGETTLQKLVETDEGAARLGEVALVPHSSPISQTGLLFYNSLYDENASCHLALGRAYPFCLAGGTTMSEEELAAAGGNHSLTHEDFMIGSGEMNVDGITRDGATEPIMRAGEWAF